MINKILIIEDDTDMCNELSEALMDMGYQVKLAFDGLNGKKIIGKENFDLIVLDLKIPKLDGYQILKFIDQKKIMSKVIVITARMKINYEDIALRIQEQKKDNLLKRADFILIKPFKLTELIKRIEAL